jgi:thioredoxin
MVLEIDSVEQFDSILLDNGSDAHNKKIIIVDFFATWCGPCKKFAPTYEKISEKYKEQVYFLKIDIDEVEDLAVRYDIRKLPTFLFFKTGTLESDYEPTIGCKEDAMTQKIDFILESGSNDIDNFDF